MLLPFYANTEHVSQLEDLLLPALVLTARVPVGPCPCPQRRVILRLQQRVPVLLTVYLPRNG